jgi:ribosomal protein S27AE
MPQRSFRTSHEGPFDLSRYDLPPLSSTDERALERVGFNKNVWEALNWFVQLAKKDLEASKGDLLILREDLAALRKVHLRISNADDEDNQPTDEEIGDFQRTVRQHLEELADRGYTFLPETAVEQRIEYPHIMEKLAIQEGYKPHPQASKLPDCTSLYRLPHSITGLVAVMGRLLEKVGTLIVRCPKCRNIFLQSRRNQEYCGRSCQSIAFVQRRRAEAKARATKKTAAKKPRTKATARGESRHGTKKR